MSKKSQLTGIAIAFSLFAVLMITLLIWSRYRPVHGNEKLPVIGMVDDFELIERNNQPFKRSDLEGRVWVADFIFTRCGGPCPMMSSHMSQLQQAIGRLKDVALVSFSIDPDYDTPEVLSKYAEEYRAREGIWYFLTGDREKIFDLARNGMKISVKGATETAPITHGTHFVLVDKLGRIRGYYDINSDNFLGKLAVDISILREEGA